MSGVLLAVAAGILLLLLVLVFLFGLLAFQGFRKKRRRQRIQEAMDARADDWYSCLIGGTLDIEQLAPSTKIDIEAADEMLFRYRRNFISGPIHSRIVRYAETYLESYYCKLLHSRRWSIRMNTLQRIALFDLRFMLTDVLAMADRGRGYSKEELLLLYKIIAMQAPAKFVSYFTHPAQPLGEFDYRRLITPLSEDQLALLCKQFDELPDVMAYVIVDAVGANHYLRLLPLLEDCLVSDDPELRIRALKAISLNDAFPSLPAANGFAESPLWEERLMAAKVFPNAPLDVAHATLTVLLSDDNYQVRRQAAVSLHSLKSGNRVLAAFIQQSEDPYAIELAAEMIGKE